jgi:hypothetical protein
MGRPTEVFFPVDKADGLCRCPHTCIVLRIVNVWSIASTSPYVFKAWC